jgi:hypothetical protein
MEARPAFIGISYRFCGASGSQPLFRAYEIAPAPLSKSYGPRGRLSCDGRSRGTRKDSDERHCANGRPSQVDSESRPTRVSAIGADGHRSPRPIPGEKRAIADAAAAGREGHPALSPADARGSLSERARLARSGNCVEINARGVHAPNRCRWHAISVKTVAAPASNVRTRRRAAPPRRWPRARVSNAEHACREQPSLRPASRLVDCAW